MADRFSATLTSAPGTTVLPSSSLYAGANKDVRLFELHIFNTTSTSARYSVVRLDTAGTKGSAILDNPYEPGKVSAAEVFPVHTVGPTIDERIEELPVGAVIGAGFILTFGDKGILIAAGVANGIGVVLGTGTGQAMSTTYVWEE